MKTLLVSLVIFSLPFLARGQKGSAPIDGVRPGVSTRAEVDLAWGEPGARLGGQSFEYAAPAALPGAQRVVVTYFGDTTQVSRIDIYLTNPAPPDKARADATLGVRTLVRDRERGEQEEFYASSLRGLILSSKDAGARVSALSYLSARYLADLYAERFHVCMREKRYADARVEAEKTVAIDNDYARGYLLEGDFFASVGNDEEGLVRYIAAASAKYPPNYVFRGHLVLITQYGLRKKWLDKAQGEFQQALLGAGDAGDRAEAHRLWADVLLDQKREADALAELNRAVEAEPNDTRSHLALADLYYGKREYGTARPHYEAVARVLDAGPAGEPAEHRRREIYFRYAYALSEAHDPGKAEKYYRAALELDPREGMTLNNLGVILNATGRVPEALDLYRRGLAVRPDDQRLLNNYAEGLLHDGRYEEARQQAQHEVSLKANDGQAKAIVARAWGAQGKKKEALEWLRQSAAAGYHNRELASDPAFRKMAKDEVFRKIVEQMK
jgi:Tfp pilus assembly protein PilF